MNDIEYLKKYIPKKKLSKAFKKMEKNIPVQYIVGNVDFYGNKIKVNKNVLIPRFETEELIEKTLKYLPKKNIYDIVDLGTGSGCIAITLKKLLNAHVDAVDISSKALKIAKKNAKLNKVTINFYHGNMLNSVKNNKYDLIISNPPYISYDEEIMDIVKNNEPHLALYAKKDGLHFYEEILKTCSNNLNEEFLIAFEIGFTQAEAIKKIINRYLTKVDVKIEKDLSGRDRFVFIKNV